MPVIKLTDELKQDIKDFFAACNNKHEVARKFQISIPTVYRLPGTDRKGLHEINAAGYTDKGRLI